MAIDGILLLASATVFFVGVFIFAYAAVMRLAGRRSRFDHLAEVIARTQGAGVYPPSLRGNPDPQVIESEETERGTNAVSGSPNSIDRRSRPQND